MGQGSFDLESLRRDALAGRLTRRGVLKRAAVLGLSAPVIASLLAACGSSDKEEATKAPDSSAGNTPEATQATGGNSDATATAGGDAPASATSGSSDTPGSTAGHGRGKGDLLRILYWQAPTILNPHFSQGDKDTESARLVVEPLLNIAADGSMLPCLVEEVPSLENGGVAKDGKSVTYKLKKDVVWSDGEPFTAEDVKFTWEFAINPDTAATTFATYAPIDDIEIVDDHTVTLKFKEANPAWYTAFSGAYGGQVIPKHLLQDFVGEKARTADFNLKPIGTGPYKVTEFRPGDVILLEVNDKFREADKPYFSKVELKGGGDATAAARAVLQSGETDYSWNLQVEKDVLEKMTASEGTGKVEAVPGNSAEQILLNFADPNKEVDGARSEPTTTHPFLSDKSVREALKIASDRETIATQLYGDAGAPTVNILVGPTIFSSPNMKAEYDLDAAAKLLDDAGWKLDGGTRKKGDVELKVLYTTTNSPIRQKTQEVLKQSWEKIGIKTELKAIDAGVYFSSDAGNPDTVAHFYADVTMFTNGPTSPYPIDYMAAFKSNEPETDIAQKSNSWSGSNYDRWVNEDYNKMWVQARTELDPDEQKKLFIGMNDLVVGDVARFGLVHRASVNGFSNRIKGHVASAWESALYDVADWYEE